MTIKLRCPKCQDTDDATFIVPVKMDIWCGSNGEATDTETDMTYLADPLSVVDGPITCTACDYQADPSEFLKVEQ